MTSVEDLQKDLDELIAFKEQATRENTKSAMSREISRVNRLLQQAEAAALVQQQRQAAAAEEEKKAEVLGPSGQAVDFSDMQFTQIKDYGWDQDKPGLIKVYLLKGLEGIGAHDKEAI